jgi:2-keto-4-pentenoate hydratase/2-oxohepta-3-ene-1,7-dioic acid hydratase in catechol pathway
MIWCRYRDTHGPRFAIVEGDVAQPVDGTPFDGPGDSHGRALPFAELPLLPPVEPRTFFCVGMNYRAHAARAHAKGYAGAPVADRPEVGYRANNALIAHGDPIVRPADYDEPLEAEGELVAVIGKTVRHCTPAEAREAVLGWTIGNDVSARAWQRSDRTFWRSKNSDAFKPMGPCIVTDVDPLQSTTTVAVNGEAKATFPTGDMIFDPYEYIREISRYITLSPGDVLWMGTDETPSFVPGDTVEVSITGLGTLSNPVVQEVLS